MIKRAIVCCLLSAIYLSLLSCAAPQFRAGKKSYNEAVILIVNQKGYLMRADEVKDLFAKAKEDLISSLHTENLDERERITAISIIARAYLEEENYDKAEEFIASGVEIIDTAKRYTGDETLVSIIKGDALVKYGKNALLNIKEKSEGLKTIAREKAIGYFSEALFNYYLGEGKSGNLTVERILDLRKIAGFIEKATVWKTHTTGGKEEASVNAANNFRSAKEIAEKNVNKKLAFDVEFKRYLKTINAELEKLEDY